MDFDLIQQELAPIVPFDPTTEKANPIDLSSTNQELIPETYTDTAVFSDFIDRKRIALSAKYLFGGYKETRNLYLRSEHFNDNEEPRSLHLGIDIWGEAGTLITTPLDGRVHSFAFNDHFGDYGATIILKHELGPSHFHTLYGHLAIADLKSLYEGKSIKKGESFCHFGEVRENGNWPPHLHFQLILDMGSHKGDYPGVCTIADSAKYLGNSPDPAIFFPFIGVQL